jgi:hypothetical protein
MLSLLPNLVKGDNLCPEEIQTIGIYYMLSLLPNLPSWEGETTYNKFLLFEFLLDTDYLPLPSWEGETTYNKFLLFEFLLL